ncbi:MAG: TIGR00730 family Rossman fold protein [Planctomycetia bacterium]
MRRLCVFCGSSPGRRPIHREVAETLGREMVRRGIDLVYGGGSVGLMGVVADTVLARGGTVHGVIPELLAKREILHSGVQVNEVVPSMHVRKARMAELADGFVTLPGGFGTFEELLEIVTWAQLGIHHKPIGVLNVDGFYDPLRRLLNVAVDEEFIKPINLELLLFDDEAPRLLDRLAEYTPPRKPQVLGLPQS